MADEEEFKVIDRRGSKGESSPKAAEPETPKNEKQKGDGFVMSEGKEPEADPTEIDFATLIYSLATTALIQMGLGPEEKKAEKNLQLARQNINLLAMLREKTKGNLTPQESELMEGLLADIRVRFVQVSKNQKA